LSEPARFFLLNIIGLNTAAGAIQRTAVTDQAGIKAGIAGACSACHKACRQPE
jgi:cytochrome c556